MIHANNIIQRRLYSERRAYAAVEILRSAGIQVYRQARKHKVVFAPDDVVTYSTDEVVSIARSIERGRQF